MKTPSPRWILATIALTLGAGTAAAVGAVGADETTGTNTACVTAPDHTIGVDGADVATVTGTATCNTVTYTIPTSTTTETGATTTETDTVTGPTTTETVTVTPTTSTSSTTSSTTTAASTCPVAQPQTTWASVGRAPLTDAQAAACVQHVPELATPNNTPYNAYIPTASQEQDFQDALTGDEHLPQTRLVDGLDGLTNPSTDDLIQWASYKWGIPTDWVRADAVQETHWRQVDPGDIITLNKASDYTLYPVEARLSGATCSSSCRVGRSNGLMQVSWTAPGEPGSSFPGVNPLYQQSTAFNTDYYGMSIRYFYDGHCTWCSSGYTAGQQWASIGAWYQPNPWQNSGAVNYESSVQTHLANTDWPH